MDEAAAVYEAKLRKEDRWNGSSESWLDNFVNAIGPKMFMADIDPTEISAYFRQRAALVEGASVNREIDVARALWRATERAKYDTGDMPDWAAMRYAIKEHDPRELHFDEEDRLFEFLRKDYHPFVKFALLSGWRVSEVRGLLWSDLDIPAKVALRTQKGGNRLKRPLTTDMIVLIASQPQACPQVFTYICKQSREKRRAGQRYPISRDGWRKVWASALAQAEISEFRFHDLRHTRGTRILRQTGNLAAAQKALAHRNIKTTLRYAHAFDEDVRNALEASEYRHSPGVPEQDTKKSA